jgi:hypothetical protein
MVVAPGRLTVSLKTQSDQQIRRVLHRPVEPAPVFDIYLEVHVSTASSWEKKAVPENFRHGFLPART